MHPDTDELGAHVSAAGGPQNAPARAADIQSVVLQLFTKQPNRWAERDFDAGTVTAFREARRAHGIRCAVSHDSYLINLSSPREDLWRRSLDSFTAELRRSAALGLDFVVTHPGNATDGDLDAGRVRNARGVADALRAVPDGPTVLLEITAGSGTSVGATFQGLARILEEVPDELQDRLGICFDTCHAWAAGYDLAKDWDGVWEAFDELVGLSRLRLFHLNDSRHPMGSRKDRHADIGAGTLGEEPFRRLMRDPRFRDVPKILETPKGEDVVTADLANLGRLRAYRME